MSANFDFSDVQNQCSNAVSRFWSTRQTQVEKQKGSGIADQGFRGAVTGGAQMDGFIALFSSLIENAGIDRRYIFTRKALELPGYFRATKEWDLLVVKDNQLLVMMEAKSQVGPSFGNNFNNRTEEAMGSALDFWTAYREGAFPLSPQPFLGYFFLLEDCPQSRAAVRVKEPHFRIFPEFTNSSYITRYEIFCRKLVRERHYSATALITSDQERGKSGFFQEPAPDLTIDNFSRALIAHLYAWGN